jgi:hypothetical protein
MWLEFDSPPPGGESLLTSSGLDRFDAWEEARYNRAGSSVRSCRWKGNPKPRALAPQRRQYAIRRPIGWPPVVRHERPNFCGGSKKWSDQ